MSDLYRFDVDYQDEERGIQRFPCKDGDYVLAVKDGHTCPWTLCTEIVPARLWGCKEHWFQVPPNLRNTLEAAYVPGQEPSKKYVAAQKAIRLWVRRKLWRDASKVVTEKPTPAALAGNAVAYHNFCFKGANPHPGEGRRPLTEQQEKIYNLARVGWNPSQIANRLNITTAAAYDGLHKVKNNGWDINAPAEKRHNQ